MSHVSDSEQEDMMSEYNFKAKEWGLLIAAVVIVVVVSILMGMADEHDVNNRPEQPTTNTGTVYQP